MAFKEILTQEDFDIAIGERLKREREAAEKKYAGFDEAKEKAAKYDELIAKDFESQVKKLTEQLAGEKAKHADHDKIVSDLTARATAAERSILKSRIAHEAGLPFELAERQTGETEDDLREDAKNLSGFVKPTTAPPLASTEPSASGSSGNSAKQAALMALANSLNTK